MITLEHVTKTFRAGGVPIKAVDDVSITIARGEIYGVIGYSGAGKSTLIRLLNGLEKPGSGRITVAGEDIGGASEAGLRRARLRIGMIFQHFNLLWSRTVRRNVAFPLEIAAAPRARIAARVAELIRLVGLEGREDAYPAQLSGGQKQRVGIARALANEPAVLLCDEATSALDPQTTDQILDLLSEINRSLGLTIVLITHEMHVVRRICDRVAVMEDGRVVEEGRTGDIFAAPREAVTQRFVRQLTTPDTVAPFDPARVAPERGAILRLGYTGAAEEEPLLAQAIRRHALPIGILHGRVSQAADGPHGEIYVAAKGSAEEVRDLVAFLDGRGAAVEIVREA